LAVQGEGNQRCLLRFLASVAHRRQSAWTGIHPCIVAGSHAMTALLILFIGLLLGM